MTTTQTKTKRIEWSYPTSSNAKQFGFEQSGCFTLHTANMEFVPFDGHKTVAGFATLAEAKQAGEPLPFPWHPAMSEGWRSQ